MNAYICIQAYIYICACMWIWDAVLNTDYICTI